MEDNDCSLAKRTSQLTQYLVKMPKYKMVAEIHDGSRKNLDFLY